MKHRRSRRVIVMMLTVVVLDATAALGDISTPGYVNCWPISGGRVACEIDGRTYVDGVLAESDRPVAGADAAPNRRFVPYERITAGPDGQPCTTTGWREVTDPTVPDGIYQIPDADFTNVLAGLPPPCPEPAGAGAAVSPRSIAVRHWEEIPLPKPNPHIAPGWGITGKLAYLETNGTTTYTHTSPTPLGELRIVARGRYVVDWGDGEESGPHSGEGGPWPRATSPTTTCGPVPTMSW